MPALLHCCLSGHQSMELRGDAAALASVVVPAKSPVSECCSLCNCFRAAKIQTLCMVQLYALSLWAARKTVLH